VQATTTRPSITVTADGEGVVSHAGSRLLADVADRTTLTARLADQRTYAQNRIEFGSALSRVRVALERRGDRPVLRVTSAQPINEPFLELKMAPKDAGAGLPPAIPPGLRAISVKVNEVIGVAGYVLPGTRVDVVATASPNGSPQDATSKVILSNVQVLTAGTRMEQDQEKGKPMQVTVVTLLVYPEQSERLALASTEGKIQLALRNPLDQGAPETPGMKQGVLLGAVKAAPARQVASNSGHKATMAPSITI